MSGLERFNPAPIALYFVCVSLVVMLRFDPVLASLSLIGGVLTFSIICRGREKTAARHVATLLVFLASAAVNPIVSHNGESVLLVINNAPITLEAILYGVVAAGGISAVLYWFYTFSSIMTSERLLYIFSVLSARAALVLSMTLRYVPMMLRQRKRISDAQRVLGAYKDDSLFTSFRASVSNLSALLTWSLENGIISADSMAARGYGTSRRSRVSPFGFKASDFVFLGVTLLLSAVCLLCLGKTYFVFYPAVTVPKIGVRAAVGYCAYAALVLMPIAVEVKEMLKWKYYASKM